MFRSGDPNKSKPKRRWKIVQLVSKGHALRREKYMIRNHTAQNRGIELEAANANIDLLIISSWYFRPPPSTPGSAGFF
jgi:hypothetical protein